jgi:uncharacterized membrane protein YphA (DoxX/SURF4 family)
MTSGTWSLFFLRLGLGITFAWIGVDMFLHPAAWLGFVPTFLPPSLSRELALQVFAALDALLGLLLILGYWRRTVAAAATLHLAGILLTQGIDAVLIRDVGLLGAALALLLAPAASRPYHRRRSWWRK